MLSIRFKLLVAFSVVVALAIGASYYGIRAISEAGHLVVQLYDEPFMAASHAQAAQAHFSEARAAMVRGLLLEDTGNADALAKAVNDVLEELKIVRERTVRATDTAAIANAERMTQDWYQTGLQIIKPPPGGITALPIAANVLREADLVATAIDQVVEDASAYGFEFRSNAEATVVRSRSDLIALALAIGSVGILLSLGIAYSFGHAIRTAMAVSERIAVGNLSEQISTTRRDELGRLLVSLGRMQESLRAQGDSLRSAAMRKEQDNAAQIARRQDVDQLIADFRGSIRDLLKKSEEVMTRMTLIARTLLRTSNETKDRAREAAGAAEETSANVATVAAGTEQLDSSARIITDKLAAATEVVDRATEMAHDMDEMIGDLTGSVERIDNVTNLIRDIADQTNLLALNATIEAARAGEAGRGFAVVASEVKSLANNTSKATEEIGLQISGVQSSANNAADRIRSIALIMSQITDVTTEIARAIQHQRAATEEISRNIHSAASATRDVARNVVGTTSAISDSNRAAAEVLEVAEYMTQNATALRTSVDRFLHDVGSLQALEPVLALADEGERIGIVAA